MITLKDFTDLKTQLVMPDEQQRAMVDVRSAFVANAISGTYSHLSEQGGVMSGHVLHGTTPIRVLSLRRWQSLNLPLRWLTHMVNNSPPNQSIVVVRKAHGEEAYPTVRDVVKDCDSNTLLYAFTLAELMDWVKDEAPVEGVVYGTHDAAPFVDISTKTLFAMMTTSVHPPVRWGHTWGFHAGKHPDGGNTVFPTVHVTRAFVNHYKRELLP